MGNLKVQKRSKTNFYLGLIFFFFHHFDESVNLHKHIAQVTKIKVRDTVRRKL